MATIDGLGPAGPLRPGSRAAAGGRGAGSFAVPADQQPALPDAAALGAAGALRGLDSLLLLQEASDPTGRDRAARRRAGDLLRALANLQQAMLVDGEAAAVQLLEALLHDLPAAADPALADLAAAVALRARVELARRGR